MDMSEINLVVVIYLDFTVKGLYHHNEGSKY